MIKRILCIICFLSFPWVANAQIFTEMPTESQDVGSDNAIETYCQVTDAMYRVVDAFADRMEELEKNRERQERVTLEREREAKLDPEAAKKRERTAQEIYMDNLFTKEPTVCADIDAALNQFVLENGKKLQNAVDELVRQSKSFNDADKADFANRLASCTNPQRKPHIRSAEKILYSCIYRNKNIRNVPLNYSVEKTMRKFFAIQAPLIDAWLGNVD